MPAKTREQKLEDMEKAAEEAANVVTEYAVPAVPQTPQASEEVVAAEDHTAAIAQFEAALKSMWPIAGTLVGVQCPLEGYRWLKCWFRINNSYAVSRLFELMPPVDGVLFTIFPQFVRGFEVVPQEDAVPTAEEIAAIAALDARQPATFEKLFNEAYDLMYWMRNGGYTEALRKPVGEASAS